MWKHYHCTLIFTTIPGYTNCMVVYLVRIVLCWCRCLSIANTNLHFSYNLILYKLFNKRSHSRSRSHSHSRSCSRLRPRSYSCSYSCSSALLFAHVAQSICFYCPMMKMSCDIYEFKEFASTRCKLTAFSVCLELFRNVQLSIREENPDCLTLILHEFSTSF